ncbi:hypothetical protein [Agathobaculum desmolans]|uniref:hypothetical protein n=1 Tax=Agathobaculum desmolans TaxID=39484 RepID=UPI00248EDB5D|nr:hypothetical protein [Agathobaculum desmolans]
MIILMLLGFVFVVLPLIATVEIFFEPWRPDNLVSMSLVAALAAWLTLPTDKSGGFLFQPPLLSQC